jgi:lipopolysaccharide/colanic/teichoic acid biosynthesis glycosyltransferase
VRRIIDIGVASLGLLVLAPLMAVVALVVAFSLGAPILFRQERPGRFGRPFTIYKFRTMIDRVDGAGVPLSDAARLTTIGRLLRAWSLDELPELWNVLRGEMSIVGPRPLLTEYLSLYDAEQARRHDVRPGLTGWAQINGRNAISWKDRLALDVWYVDNRSLLLDLRIIFLTIRRVLARDGINHPASATMERFRGSAG